MADGMSARPWAFLLGAALIAVLCIFSLGGSHMLYVDLDMGKNIVETAKRSGAPRWAADNVAGLITYELVNLAPDVHVRYLRDGYQFTAKSLFSVTLHADQDLNNDLAVEAAALQFNTAALTSHEIAKNFVEELILQFQKAQWKRYLDPLCPAVTGRSSYLNEVGALEQLELCPLDPAYRLSMEDWQHMMSMAQHYQWIGDGILATLKVSFASDSRGLTYSIDLELDDYKIKVEREERNRLDRLAEGDAMGWNSTASMNKDLEELRLRIQAWENSARARGDMVLMR